MRQFKLTTYNTTLDHLNACLLQMQAPNNFVVDFSQALTQETEQRAADLRNQLDSLMTARENAQAQKAACDAQEALLVRRIRDAFQLVKRQTRVPDYPVQLFEAYGLLRDGTQSRQVRELKAPVQAAYQIVAAEAVAVSRGFPALTDPTPEELTLMADELVLMKEALTVARNDERFASDAILAERDAVALLLRKIRMSVKLATVGMDRVVERDLLRSMGFKYGNATRSSAPTETPGTQADDGAVADGSAVDGAVADAAAGDAFSAAEALDVRGSQTLQPPAPMLPATDPTFQRAVAAIDAAIAEDAA